MNFTIKDAIKVQERQVKTLALVYKKSVIKSLKKALAAKNAQAESPADILRGMQLDNILINHAHFLAGQGGVEMEKH